MRFLIIFISLFLYAKENQISVADNSNSIKKVKIFNIFKVIENNQKLKKKVVKKEINISKDISSTNLDLPLYAKLSLELVKNNKLNINKLLKKHHNQLPVRDRVQAEIQTGDIKQTYNDAYFNMKNDYSDYLSYKQARDLYIKYSNRINILTKLNNLDKINVIDNSMSAKIYIFNPYYLYLKTNSLLSQNNNSSYKNIQSFDNDTKVGIQKLTNRGSFYAEIGERISKENFFEYLLRYNTFIKYISYEGSIGINQKSTENSYLLYAGKTNYFKNDFTFNITNKDIFSLNLDYNRYYSQDNFYLGNSIIEYLKYTRKLRLAYPDFSYYGYFKNANYSKTSNKGDTKQISTINNFDVLSKSYYETGVGFLFGWRHYDTYTKIWRPFIDTSLFYNSLNDFGINFSAGIGGGIYHQDNLSLLLNYSSPLKGLNNYLEFVLDYNLWF